MFRKRIEEIWHGDVEWIQLALDTDQLRWLVDMLMNISPPKRMGYFYTSWVTIVFLMILHYRVNLLIFVNKQHNMVFLYYYKATSWKIGAKTLTWWSIYSQYYIEQNKFGGSVICQKIPSRIHLSLCVTLASATANACSVENGYWKSNV
jgi:hypothetical protein